MAGPYRNAAEVAHLLGGHRSGNGWLCRCPVLGHGRNRGDLHPSLSVSDGDRRLLVHCFAGCDARDVLAALGTRGVAEHRESPPVMHGNITPDDPTEKAMTLWRASQDIRGTVAEIYLRNRGITIALPPTVRSWTWMIPGGAKPAMIVCVECEHLGIVAVQTTIVTADGHKADIDVPRRILGRLGDGAVRLGKPGAELGLAEGVETALTAMQLTGIPTWASLGANRMDRVAVPPGVRVVHVFADADEAGRSAAERTAQHQTSLGRTVKIYKPPSGCDDFNQIRRFAA